MKVCIEYKVLDGDVPFIERYTHVIQCEYSAHDNNLKIYRDNSEIQYAFLIDLSDVKEFSIEN